LLHRTRLCLLKNIENIFDLEPAPDALLIDLEGTLTGFGPSRTMLVDAITLFDSLVATKRIPISRVHYVTNSGLEGIEIDDPSISARLHRSAGKPFFSPPTEFSSDARSPYVIGDQYLTDGLLAWRKGFSFALLKTQGSRPIWPRIQFFAGRILSPIFFELREPKTST
jgi:hypothetical protein